MTTYEARIVARVLRLEALGIASARQACDDERRRLRSSSPHDGIRAREYEVIGHTLALVVRRLRTRATRLERGTDLE